MDTSASTKRGSEAVSRMVALPNSSPLEQPLLNGGIVPADIQNRASGLGE